MLLSCQNLNDPSDLSNDDVMAKVFPLPVGGDLLGAILSLVSLRARPVGVWMCVPDREGEIGRAHV